MLLPIPTAGKPSPATPEQKARQYLEKVDICKGVAEAEHVFLLGVLWHGLHDAVLCKQSAARCTALVQGILPIGLIEQQGASWGERSKARVLSHVLGIKDRNERGWDTS